MNKDEFHPFDGQFEPQAEAVAKGNPYIPLPEIAQASIAISLKRIADTLAPRGGQDIGDTLFHIEQYLGPRS
jgi:hypothetical protein